MATEGSAPGTLMPSENTLVETFAVSRSTIRKALRSLQDEGFLEQRQGQGTFLKKGHYRRNFSSRMDFFSHGADVGARPSTTLLSLDLRAKSIAEVSLFAGSPATEVVEIRRLRLMQGEPCVLQTSVLQIPELAEYSTRQLEMRSLYKILEKDFGLRVGAVEETLTCENASEHVAERLRIEPGVAVFVSHRVVRSEQDVVVEISQKYIRSDKYCFVQDAPPTEPRR